MGKLKTWARTPAKSPSPFVEEAFKRINARNVSYEELAAQAETSRENVTAWKTGVEPKLFAFERLCHAAGYKIVLEPIG